MHNALAKSENDHEFKMYILKKLDAIESEQIEGKSDLKIFKMKVYVLIVALVSAKETIVKKLLTFL